jgi:predicted SprT family Zn-dependent metalloprotease
MTFTLSTQPAQEDSNATCTSSESGPPTATSQVVTPTMAQFESLQKLFNHFNGPLFGGELEDVLLNLSRKGSRVLGFFAPDCWQGRSGEDKPVSEISLNPRYLGLRTPEATASTLVHEMCHLWQHLHGKAGRRGYHNKQWAQKMETVGLIASDSGLPGGRKTGERMTHYVLDDGPFSRAFARMPQDWFLPFVEGPPVFAHGVARSPVAEPTLSDTSNSDRSKTRYSCAGCETHVWGKPGLALICGFCHLSFAIG